jgi:hypothetical protein
MTRAQAIPYVSYVIDDVLSEHPVSEMLPNARLVGWQCGFEPMFVAVQSYLPNTRVDDCDADEIAIDFLTERGWFAGEPREPDYII